MSLTNENYNYLEFSGSFLVPSFSIYLLELIEEEGERFFYVGMTGDSYYPSARSALHRLAGHIDMGKNSTQNQLVMSLKKIFNTPEGRVSAEELKTLKIVMHHWAIPGFEEWKGGLKNFKKEDTSREKYLSYKAIQEKVLKLENQIIYKVKQLVNDNCLNETDGVNENDLLEYNYISDAVLKIIK
jgi:hypothetical protein